VATVPKDQIYNPDRVETTGRWPLVVGNDTTGISSEFEKQADFPDPDSNVSYG